NNGKGKSHGIGIFTVRLSFIPHTFPDFAPLSAVTIFETFGN
ncbi:unnamed protein product, partial [marine sediment metagenome]